MTFPNGLFSGVVIDETRKINVDILMLTLALTVSVGAYLWWGFSRLSAEKWQFLASVPGTKLDDGSWQGTNFTFYGFFIAVSYTAAIVACLFLMSAAGMGQRASWLTVTGVFAFAMPASRLVARLVEKKAHTFTVGGAFFVGILIAPWVSWGASLAFKTGNGSENVLAACAALSIAYAFGEGMGRLSCISFGCCYGKPVESLPPFWRNVFGKANFVFHGKTRKIAFAHGLDETRVVPVQAMTAVIYCLSGVAGVWLFLTGHYTAAFWETILITQVWRFASEFLRADYRGQGKISAYQYMAVLGLLYAFLLPLVFPSSSLPSSHPVSSGFRAIWNPSAILAFQAIWIMVFLRYGKSTVTGSTLRFFVHTERT